MTDPAKRVVFDLDGVICGPVETADIRNTLIQIRKGAIRVNNFQLAVYMSNTIMLIHLMAYHIWPDEWQLAVAKVDEDLR